MTVIFLFLRYPDYGFTEHQLIELVGGIPSYHSLTNPGFNEGGHGGIFESNEHDGATYKDFHSPGMGLVKAIEETCGYITCRALALMIDGLRKANAHLRGVENFIKHVIPFIVDPENREFLYEVICPPSPASFGHQITSFVQDHWDEYHNHERMDLSSTFGKCCTCGFYA